MSQLPDLNHGRPPKGRLVDGMTWGRFLKLEQEKRRRYENGLDDIKQWHEHQRDFARKREQFFR